MTTTDMVIDLENDQPGELARVARALSDAGINIAAATALGHGRGGELHVLVHHPEAVRHVLAVVHSVSISREREVVVVQAEDRPGELADLTGKIAAAGVNLDLVYVATGSRVVFGSDDLDALRAALAGASIA
ncbi:MAG: ACT domain-containing protein [Candidatus Sulfomarinibacteraceae bacterium]